MKEKRGILGGEKNNMVKSQPKKGESLDISLYNLIFNEKNNYMLLEAKYYLGRYKTKFDNWICVFCYAYNKKFEVLVDKEYLEVFLENYKLKKNLYYPNNHISGNIE